MRNNIIIVILIVLSFTGTASAATTVNYLRNVLPETNDSYDLGTTTPALEWNNIYVKNIVISGSCTGCGAAPAGGGGGGMATSSLAVTYPFTLTVSTSQALFALAFGTTTSNTWAGTQTFTNQISGSISGNAGTASALATARAINGVNFDGSIPITINAASSSALSDNNTFSGTNTFNNQITGSVSGNAGTATLLQNPRTINTVSFNGGSNITINAASSTVLGDRNTWSAMQTLAAASSTDFTASHSLYTSVTNALLAADVNKLTYGVATSSETCTAPLSCAAFGVFNGGALSIGNASAGVTGALTGTDWSTFNNKQATLAFTTPLILNGTTVAFSGLSTTTPTPASSNVLVSNGGAGVYGAATSSETCTAPLSCGAHVVLTGGGAISIGSASAGVTGALTGTDWSTFNGKQAAISVTTPLTLTAAAISYSGISTSTALVGGGVVATTDTKNVYSQATSTQTLSAWFSTTGTMGSDVGGTSGTLSRIDTLQFSIGTSTKSTALNGTTTVYIENVILAETVTAIRCSTDVGTVNVDLYQGSTHMNQFNASTTNNQMNITTNGALAAGNLFKADVGTPLTAVHYVQCTIKVTR